MPANMDAMRALLARLLMAAALVLAACSSTSVQVQTVARPAKGALHKIALLPLVNHASSTQAAAAVAALLETSLVSRAGVQLVAAHPSPLFDPAKLDRELARDIGAALGADAVLTGAVFSFAYERGERHDAKEVPALYIDLRLFSTTGAELLWAARASADDAPSFPEGGATLTALTDELARALTRDLAEML